MIVLSFPSHICLARRNGLTRSIIRLSFSINDDAENRPCMCELVNGVGKIDDGRDFRASSLIYEPESRCVFLRVGDRWWGGRRISLGSVTVGARGTEAAVDFGRGQQRRTLWVEE